VGKERGIQMDADDIAGLFTRRDGEYLCARWGRPVVPVVFGVDDATLGVVKGAIEAVVALAQHNMAETDPEGVRIIRHKVSRQDMAKVVGASREMVSRLLRDLETGGYIAVRDRHIVLLKRLPARW
jgi:hypothetical protein